MSARPAAAASAQIHAQLRPEPRWYVRLGRTSRRHPLGAVGAVLIIVLLTAALFGPDLNVGGRTIVPGFSPYPAQETNIIQTLQGPTWSHIAGTDTLGRDVLSRIIHGARPAAEIGVVSTVLGVAAGTVIGLVSGYFAGSRVRIPLGGGRYLPLPETDLVIQRVMDTVMAVPPLIFLMVVLVVLRPTIWSIVAVFVMFLAPTSQRVIRGAVLAVREVPYVEAARATGAHSVRVMFVHLLPNVMAPVIVLASVTIGGVILTEAALSFLGLGASSDKSPTWGVMLNEAVGRGSLDRFPWLAIAPGVAITLTVLAFNLLGDAMRDILDPRLRGR